MSKYCQRRGCGSMINDNNFAIVQKAGKVIPIDEIKDSLKLFCIDCIEYIGRNSYQVVMWPSLKIEDRLDASKALKRTIVVLEHNAKITESSVTNQRKRVASKGGKG